MSLHILSSLLSAVSKLLEKGSGDPNVCSADGLTPLHKVRWCLKSIGHTSGRGKVKIGFGIGGVCERRAQTVK